MKAFWRWLTTSRYTRRLEDENEELKAEIAEYKRLLIRGYGITPVSRNQPSPVVESPRPANSPDKRANPGIVQFKRTNWSDARNKLELLTNTSIQTEQRMQKAVNAHKDI